jgi:Beta-lactamase
MYPAGSMGTWHRLSSGTGWQLAGRGQIDLDRDINAYLDFTIPPMFGKPITMRNLLTHTAGFVEAVKGSSFIEPSPLPPLSDYLKKHLPARIFAPGEVAAYSNYANALAGYVVERVTGTVIPSSTWPAEPNDGWARMGSTVLAIGCLTISWFSFAFNLLTLNLEY